MPRNDQDATIARRGSLPWRSICRNEPAEVPLQTNSCRDIGDSLLNRGRSYHSISTLFTRQPTALAQFPPSAKFRFSTFSLNIGHSVTGESMRQTLLDWVTWRATFLDRSRLQRACHVPEVDAFRVPDASSHTICMTFDTCHTIISSHLAMRLPGWAFPKNATINIIWTGDPITYSVLPS